jgi:hypothetical protein
MPQAGAIHRRVVVGQTGTTLSAVKRSRTASDQAAIGT